MGGSRLSGMGVAEALQLLGCFVGRDRRWLGQSGPRSAGISSIHFPPFPEAEESHHSWLELTTRPMMRTLPMSAASTMIGV